jgi:hypothetical protein
MRPCPPPAGLPRARTDCPRSRESFPTSRNAPVQGNGTGARRRRWRTGRTETPAGPRACRRAVRTGRRASPVAGWAGRLEAASPTTHLRRPKARHGDVTAWAADVDGDPGIGRPAMTLILDPAAIAAAPFTTGCPLQIGPEGAARLIRLGTRDRPEAVVAVLRLDSLQAADFGTASVQHGRAAAAFAERGEVSSPSSPSSGPRKSAIPPLHRVRQPPSRSLIRAVFPLAMRPAGAPRPEADEGRGRASDITGCQPAKRRAVPAEPSPASPAARDGDRYSEAASVGAPAGRDGRSSDVARAPKIMPWHGTHVRLAWNDSKNT